MSQYTGENGSISGSRSPTRSEQQGIGSATGTTECPSISQDRSEGLDGISTHPADIQMSMTPQALSIQGFDDTDSLSWTEILPNYTFSDVFSLDVDVISDLPNEPPITGSGSQDTQTLDPSRSGSNGYSLNISAVQVDQL